MSYEFLISLRYLRARRKQVFVSVITFISIGGILLGVAALIIVLAVMNGFESELRNKILGINSHIVLTEYGGPMQNPEAVIKEVEQVKGVIAATPFIYSQAMLKRSGDITGVVLRGLDPKTATKVIDLGRMEAGSLSSLTTEGRSALNAGKNLEGLPGIIVGKEMAKNLGISLFDTVEILTPMGISTPMGMVPRIKPFVVVGVFDSGFFEYDATLAFTSLQDSQALMNMDNRVTGIEIKVDDIYEARAIAQRIVGKLGFPYWARDWMQMNKNLFAALKLEKRVMFIILALIVLVAAFNIICTLIMVVMEKNKDIAILKSMGATSRGIMRIFVLQGLVIGGVGTFLGSITGWTIAVNLSRITQFVEKALGIKILPSDVYYLSSLPSQVNYWDLVVIIIGSLLISFIATVYPSWNASRLDPAEALRYE
jgi:lipoprotein-releasing system permease protein